MNPKGVKTVLLDTLPVSQCPGRMADITPVTEKRGSALHNISLVQKPSNKTGGMPDAVGARQGCIFGCAAPSCAELCVLQQSAVLARYQSSWCV